MIKPRSLTKEQIAGQEFCQANRIPYIILPSDRGSLMNLTLPKFDETPHKEWKLLADSEIIDSFMTEESLSKYLRVGYAYSISSRSGYGDPTILHTWTEDQTQCTQHCDGCSIGVQLSIRHIDIDKLWTVIQNNTKPKLPDLSLDYGANEVKYKGVSILGLRQKPEPIISISLTNLAMTGFKGSVHFTDASGWLRIFEVGK
jgi:hypothetical protein